MIYQINKTQLKLSKMTTNFKNTIIAQAISLGFEFNQFTPDTTIEEISERLTDFFNENYGSLPQIEAECEVTLSGRAQNVSYGDFVSSGEIVDFSAHWFDAPETRVFHSNFVMEDTDGVMKNMELYYLVGETQYNCPDGYYFNPKTQRHEIF